jgi:hypothetical protein
MWDEQIEEEAKSGRFDKMIAEEDKETPACRLSKEVKMNPNNKIPPPADSSSACHPLVTASNPPSSISRYRQYLTRPASSQIRNLKKCGSTTTIHANARLHQRIRDPHSWTASSCQSKFSTLFIQPPTPNTKALLPWGEAGRGPHAI